MAADTRTKVVSDEAPGLVPLGVVEQQDRAASCHAWVLLGQGFEEHLKGEAVAQVEEQCAKRVVEQLLAT